MTTCLLAVCYERLGIWRARASYECEHGYGWFVRIEGLGLNWNGVDMLVECGWCVERLARIGGAASDSLTLSLCCVWGLGVFGSLLVGR